jgi:Leucine-rich repeat (LRR) protein
MGIVCNTADKLACEKLLEGKMLWARGELEAFDVLYEAYQSLGRNALARIVQCHKTYHYLPKVDMLEYRAGDYHSIDAALEEPEKVKSIELGNTGFEELPDLSTMTNLEKLELWGNALKDLPESLAACKNLRRINLFRNKLEKVPEVLFQLPQLQELVLSNNAIQNVDDIERLLSDLPHLRYLDAENNPLDQEKLGELRKRYSEKYSNPEALI